MKNLMIVLLLLAAPLSFADNSIPPPVMPVQSVYRDFSFSPGRSCANGWVDASFCASAGPKNWGDFEYAEIQNYLAPLYSGKLENFRKQILQNGFHVIYRYASGLQNTDDTHFAPSTMPAWEGGLDLSINFSDLAFAAHLPPDPIGGHDIGAQTVLHELVHAFAFNQPRLMADFQKLIGWTQDPATQAWELPGVNPADVAKAMSDDAAARQTGAFLDGFIIDRKFGIAHGFPSAYSMTSPTECLAEMASYVYFDPTAPTYVDAKWIAWIRANVLN